MNMDWVGTYSGTTYTYVKKNNVIREGAPETHSSSSKLSFNSIVPHLRKKFYCENEVSRTYKTQKSVMEFLSQKVG